MERYDDIVVGSGVSGLTACLILAQNGRKVLLLEKGPHIGGSLTRFYRKGIPFDTGFHFTGGLEKGGMLSEILFVLGIADKITPVFLSEEKTVQYILESENSSFIFPSGIENIKRKFRDYFPTDASAIDAYFDRIRYICDNTPSMRISSIYPRHNYLDEDFVTLESVLDGMTDNPVLKVLLAGLVLCYGVSPKEISFANHSRMSFALYESMARVENGGEAFIKAFKEEFKKYDVTINCGRHIVELTDIREKKVGRFIMNYGQETECENCVFTIHPKEILDILPKEHLRKAFRDRVSSYESSSGFFSVFAVMEKEIEENDYDGTIFALFPDSRMDRLLSSEEKGESAICIVKCMERRGDKRFQVLNAFEPSCMDQVKKWKDSRLGARTRDYLDYKRLKTEEIMERISNCFPEYRESLKIMESASVLTFRDYLNTPDGSAYGIKQKVGQHNLLGRLPLKNLFAAGQSSLLPGILGAMMSSFIVCRNIIDEDLYGKYLRRG